MGIYIHRNLAKIGKTRIGYSKRLDGKNGCLSGCIQVLFLPFTILFSVIALIFGKKKKTASSGSARITPEPQKTMVPETTVPKETPEEKIEYSKKSMKTALIATGVFAAVIILMLMIPANDEPHDVPEPKEATAATAAETEPTRGMPVLELVTEAETEAETKAETEPQTEAATEKATETATERTTEAPSEEKPQEPEYQLELSVTSPVGNNSMATLTAKGKPNTVYHISVYYSTKESGAQGLENKTSDASGNVSWTWKVGGNTKPGKHKITVYAKNDKKDTATTEFETVE